MKKVFYVESDQLMRIALERILKDSDWEIYTLESMSDFDFRFEDFKPDLLMLDLTLFVEEPLQIDKDIVVVYVGFRDTIDKSVWITENTKVIEKPFAATKIESVINLFLEGHEA